MITLMIIFFALVSLTTYNMYKTYKREKIPFNVWENEYGLMNFLYLIVLPIFILVFQIYLFILVVKCLP